MGDKRKSEKNCFENMPENVLRAERYQVVWDSSW